MPPVTKNVNYNSPDYKFPVPTEASPIYFKKYIKKELLQIKKGSERYIFI